MPERHPFRGLIGPHQAGPFGCAERVFPAVGRDRPDEAQIAGAVQGGQQQQFADRGGKRLRAGGKDALQPVAEGQRHREGPGDGARQVAERDRELEQRERVPEGRVEQLPSHPGRQHRVALGHQLRCRLVRQRRHQRDRQVSLLEEVRLPGPAGRQQADRQPGETAGDHAEHERAGAVQPRQVVDDEQQRLFLGRLLQERQDRGGDQELRWRRPHAQVKRHVQGPGEHGAELRHLVEAREEELVQGGIGDVRLELRSGRPEQPDAGVGGEGDGNAEQRGLSDAGIARQQQRVPGSGGGLAQEPSQPLDLRLAAGQVCRRAAARVVACAEVHPPTFLRLRKPV